MNVFKKIFSDPETKARQEISDIVSIADCSAECSAEECSTKFPSSVKIETGDTLWKSTKPYKMHCLVATGKTDWPHDAFEEKGTLAHAVAAWGGRSDMAELAGGNINVNVTSFHSESSSTSDILILPSFVWVRKCTTEKADSVLTDLLKIIVEEGTLPESLHSLKIEPSYLKSYIFLCSHRTRDKRCGITAPIMKKEMNLYLRELELYRDYGDERPGGVQVEFINHVGGHKYAANVIIYLSSGETVWLARCKPTNVRPIIEQTVLAGKVWPEMVRFVSKGAPVKW